MGFSAKPVKNTGKFQRYIATTIHQNFIWELGKVKCFIRCYGVVGKARRIDNMRQAANRHQNFFSTIGCPINSDFMRTADLCPSGDQRGPGIFQQRPIDCFKPVKLGIFGRNQGRPVMRWHLIYLPAKSACIFNIRRKSRPVHQEFFRHTTADHTCTTGAVPLNHGNACPMPGGNSSSSHAA